MRESFLLTSTAVAISLISIFACLPSAIAVPGDRDDDGWADEVDNCPTVANSDQADFDSDGIGDLCDSCLATPNPAQDEIEWRRKLSGEMVTGGGVLDFIISPDGRRVLYYAEQLINGLRELFSVPINGGTAIRLNSDLPAGGSIDRYYISPDSSTVVYLADQESDDVAELYSVPIVGGTPSKLNDSLAFERDVALFRISNDSSRVVYSTDQVTDDLFELYSVPLVGGDAVKLADPIPPGGSSGVWGISPDSSTVVFAADYEADGVLDLYSVPIDGGLTLKLASSPTPARTIFFTPDSSTVVYLSWSHTELYRIPVQGGEPMKLTDYPYGRDGSKLGGIQITPDGQYVIYSAGKLHGQTAHHSWHGYHLYSVPITGGGGALLHEIPYDSTSVEDVVLSSDGTWVAFTYYYYTGTYSPDFDNPNIHSASVVGGGSIPHVDFGIYPQTDSAGSRIAYAGYHSGVSGIFIDPFDDGTPRLLVEETGVAARSLRFTLDDTKLLYNSEYSPDWVNQFYSVRTSGSNPLILNGPLVTDGEVRRYATEWSSDGITAAYRADQDTYGVVELYSVRLIGDNDSDGTLNSCDCAPDDGSAFAEPGEVTSLYFLSDDDLAWSPLVPACGPGITYELLRGVTWELPVGSGASESCLQSGFNGESWQDTEDPPAGSAPFYYLVRAVNVCATGSYGQRYSGAERASAACP
jgi:Tol biopolymer transport system component